MRYNINNMIAPKNIRIIVCALLLTVTGSVMAQDDDSKLSLYVNVGMRYNPKCVDEKIGAGVGIDAEWKFLRWIGLGTGVSYSTETMCQYENWEFHMNGASRDVWEEKIDYRMSFVNVPLRLYFHPTKWLTLDAGLQWSIIASHIPDRMEKMGRVSLSMPFGVSIGSRNSLFVGFQPRLNNTLEEDLDDGIESSQLLVGVKINLSR